MITHANQFSLVLLGQQACLKLPKRQPASKKLRQSKASAMIKLLNHLALIIIGQKVGMKLPQCQASEKIKHVNHRALVLKGRKAVMELHQHQAPAIITACKQVALVLIGKKPKSAISVSSMVER